MFYGPPAVGKTMTIIRLARYLLEHGYTVVLNIEFRSSDDSRYQSLCDRFTELMNSGSVAQGTDIWGTMLIDIIKNGKTIIQFLDTTGEVYDKAYINDIKMMYPGLLNIFQIRNPIRKIFQEYSCRILPFQTGSYHLNKYGNQLYIPGTVEYVEVLWKVIRYSIK